MAPASSSGKSGYHHGSLSQALVREGFAMVEQSGADAMTLTALAKKLGVTHAAVYRHFTDRAALLQEIVLLAFRRLMEAMDRAYRRAPHGTRRQLLDTGFEVVRFAVNRPHLYRLMFFGYQPSTWAELVESPNGTPFRTLADYVKQWQEAGVLRAADPLEIALTLWTTTHGFCCLLASGQLRIPRRALRSMADELHERMLSGID